MDMSATYTSEILLLARFDRECRSIGLRGRSETELAAWRDELRARLCAIIGKGKAPTSVGRFEESILALSGS